ncbi:putative plasmid partitioning protein (plasmid) [Oscillibacter valericigenes Sjm18-20]|nr:putative plasmid partitioning protein [Oscillibacter valericigenes Sjm18-20]
MVNKVAFINGKGGCGKTTSIFHVSGVLAKAGEKVLVIDLDKQRNTTDTLLMNTDKPEKTVLEFMQGTASAQEATAEALFQSRGNANPKYYNVDCMAASVSLEDEALLSAVDAARFGSELDAYINKRGYTWVLVDMPPSSKELNKICFSSVVDYVIVPFSSDMYSVSGYGDIMNTVQDARTFNPNLNILGVYLSRYMKNCAVDRYIKEQLEAYNTFIPVQIPLAADVREAVMFGRPISYYKMLSDSRTAYENLVEVMTRRIKAFQ